VLIHATEHKDKTKETKPPHSPPRPLLSLPTKKGRKMVVMMMMMMINDDDDFPPESHSGKKQENRAKIQARKDNDNSIIIVRA